jgi:hypothetical protein
MHPARSWTAFHLDNQELGAKYNPGNLEESTLTSGGEQYRTAGISNDTVFLPSSSKLNPAGEQN